MLQRSLFCRLPVRRFVHSISLNRICIIEIKNFEFAEKDSNDIDHKSRNVNTLIQLSMVYLEEDMIGTDWKFKENPDAKQALIEANEGMVANLKEGMYQRATAGSEAAATMVI